MKISGMLFTFYMTTILDVFLFATYVSLLQPMYRCIMIWRIYLQFNHDIGFMQCSDWTVDDGKKFWNYAYNQSSSLLRIQHPFVNQV
jgi:hypothetical protein